MHEKDEVIERRIYLCYGDITVVQDILVTSAKTLAVNDLLSSRMIHLPTSTFLKKSFSHFLRSRNASILHFEYLVLE